MIWSGEYSREWKKKFAIFPRHVDQGQTVVWLQHYWVKYVKGDQLCERCQIELSDRVVGHWVTTSKDPSA